jgi:hypothetical protein
MQNCGRLGVFVLDVAVQCPVKVQCQLGVKAKLPAFSASAVD